MLTGKQARLYYSNSVYASFQYLICTLLFLLLALQQNDSLIGYSNLSWLTITGLVLFPTILGHFISTYLMEHMNLSLMSCGKLIEPIFAAVLAYLVFKEKLTTEAIIAFLLTAASLLTLFLPNIIRSKTLNKP